MASPSIYKLVARSQRRPYVLSGALPVEYWQDHFNGSPLPAHWEAPAHTVHGTSYALSDAIAWKEQHPLLSAPAVELLEAIAPGCAEYRYFCHIKDEPYYVLNVLAVADPSDPSSCPPLFKRASQSTSDTLCTAQDPAAIVDRRLTGFGFRDPFQAETRALFLGKDTNVYPGVLA